MKENKEKLIAYCGLYCGDCHGYNQEIPDLARDLRKKLREYKYDKFANATSKFFKELKDYEACYKVLGAMVKFRCKKACTGGGGNPWCAIRKCVQKKGYDGCWECEKFPECKKFAFLKEVHGDANIKNLKRIAKKGKKEFIKGKRDW